LWLVDDSIHFWSPTSGSPFRRAARRRDSNWSIRLNRNSRFPRGAGASSW
jgi:hypothetical protein